MATSLDLISKRKRKFNSGIQRSHFEFSRIVGMFFAPKNHVITLSGNMQTQLAADAIAADDNNRIFAMPAIVGFTDSSTEELRTTFGYGGEHTAGYGRYQGMYEFADAKKALQKVLTRYNKTQNQFNLYLVDENGYLLCTKAPQDTNPRGFSLANVWAPKWQFPGESGTKLGLNIAFANATEFNENLHVIDPGFDIMSAIAPITEVELSVATALNTSRVITIYVRTGDNEESLLDDYADQLDDTTAFTGQVTTGGAALTVSSITQAVINGEKALTITFATTNYPTAGNTFLLKGAAISVWTGLGVVGFENTEGLLLTVPA